MIGFQLLFSTESAVKGGIVNLLIVPLKLVEYLQIMHGLEESKDVSCYPVIKSTNNMQYKVGMHMQHVKENNVSLSKIC